MSKEVVLAIDFGTSNSLAGAWCEGKRIEALELDPTAKDPTLLRTLLYFPHGDLCYYGAEAIHQYVENDMEGRLFRSFKSHLPNQRYLGTFVGNRPMPLENLVGIFLLEIKKRAEAKLGTTIDSAVIGRPARYAMDEVEDAFALHRMQKAAQYAGFKKVEFVAEPLAAALDLRRHLTEEKLVLVGDFGGGTSDFTLLRIGPQKFEKSHVLGLDGCPAAGDALDSLFMSQRLNEFFGAKVKYKVALGENILTMPKSIMDRLNLPAHIVHLKEPATYEFIREVRRGALNKNYIETIDRLFLLIEDQQIFSFFEHIEHTKRQLSSLEKFDFNFEYPELELTQEFTRTEFVNWAEPVKTKLFAALDECLKQGSVTPAEVDLVYLTGGSSQVPMIRNEFQARFGAEKLQTQSHFHSVLSGLVESAAHFSGN